ncbi:hypothetical protein GOP47_0022236 [Adiantum capillus-veneris]|uniref:Secreted protein n=1 Tax=Adiantum capillus-veneris TaxID=13818 RepID=A0A9D4UAM8_ADICA|nr:hypothetical protein GOP47_0022236 [Adiantum capillus-veneris]
MIMKRATFIAALILSALHPKSSSYSATVPSAPSMTHMPGTIFPSSLASTIHPLHPSGIIHLIPPHTCGKTKLPRSISLLSCMSKNPCDSRAPAIIQVDDDLHPSATPSRRQA